MSEKVNNHLDNIDKNLEELRESIEKVRTKQQNWGINLIKQSLKEMDEKKKFLTNLLSLVETCKECKISFNEGSTFDLITSDDSLELFLLKHQFGHLDSEKKEKGSKNE